MSKETVLMKSDSSYTATKYFRVSQIVCPLVLMQSPNIQLLNLLFQITCFHCHKDTCFSLQEKIMYMDCAETETLRCELLRKVSSKETVVF